MKFIDIIRANRKTYERTGSELSIFSLECPYNIDECGDVIPSLHIPVNLDSEIDVIYFYDYKYEPMLHAEEIQKAIENHDFENFLKWTELASINGTAFGAGYASVRVDGIHIGTLEITKDTIGLITNVNFSIIY